MSLTNSILVAVIVLSIVFVCLIMLSLLVRLQSFIFGHFIKNDSSESLKQEIVHNVRPQNEINEVSTGELKLIGIDEKTAAIVMAVLSDELKLSLNEMSFKYVKLINS